MSLYHAIETILVPLIVLVCAVSVASRYMPRTRERVKAALAAALGGASATGWRGRLVARLAPTQAQGCASGCDSGGCSSCGANESNAAGTTTQTPTEHTIKLVRKP